MPQYCVTIITEDTSMYKQKNTHNNLPLDLKFKPFLLELYQSTNPCGRFFIHLCGGGS